MRTKQSFKKAGIGDVIGSSFMGYLEASYGDLVAEFGEPRWRSQEGQWRSSDQKVRCEWAFVTGSGKRRLVFTIYDCKEKQPIEEVGLWHIGAKGNTQRLDRLFARRGYSGSGML